MEWSDEYRKKILNLKINAKEEVRKNLENRMVKIQFEIISKQNQKSQL